MDRGNRTGCKRFSSSTIELGTKVIGLDGDLTIVGLGGGKYECNMNGLPFGVSLTNPYWGSRTELMEVIGLALQKKIHVEIENTVWIRRLQSMIN